MMKEIQTYRKYQDAMEALFPVSYKIKFISKKEKSQDYVVMPLEGLWWVDNMEDSNTLDKSSWKWTVMIGPPDFITKSMINDAIEKWKKEEPCSII